MMQWLRKRSLPTRVLVYAAAAMLAFGLAAGVGGVGALMLRGDLNLPGREEAQPLDEQRNAARSQGKETAEQKGAAEQQNAAEQKGAAEQQNAAEQKDAAEQKVVAEQESEAEYVRKVGDMQNDSVETFLEGHEKILLYDALTADDIEQMQANEAALQEIADQAENLEPPQRYGEHHEVFSSAINELHEGAQLAYNLAADPTAATQSGFDEYDRHVNEADALLQRSNELVGQDYKTLEGVQRVNPLS